MLALLHLDERAERFGTNIQQKLGFAVAKKLLLGPYALVSERVTRQCLHGYAGSLPRCLCKRGGPCNVAALAWPLRCFC